MGARLGATGNILSIVHSDVYRHLAQMPLLAYSLFAPRKAPVRSGKKDGFLPVILVHGYGGSRGDLLPMEYYLRLRGRKRVYRIGLHPKHSVKQMSQVLARFIEKVLAVNDAQKVNIVGYSLGGIVARLAILDHALEEKVETLVTMGTPHHGTHPARFVNGGLGRSLRPESPVIQKLKEARWPKGVRGVTFWSQNDVFILPPESAIMKGTTQVNMSPFTHFSYLIDHRSWAAVRDALAS